MDVTSQDAAPFFETKTGSDKNFNPPLPETNLLPEECERPRTSRQHVCIRSRVKALKLRKRYRATVLFVVPYYLHLRFTSQL